MSVLDLMVCIGVASEKRVAAHMSNSNRGPTQSTIICSNGSVLMVMDSKRAGFVFGLGLPTN